MFKLSRKRITCLFLLAAVSAGLWFSPKTASPEQTISTFMNQMEQDQLGKAVSYMGSAGCKCQPTGGWISYLTYSGAQEPNLSWLRKQPLAVKKIWTRAEYDDEKSRFVKHKIVDVDVEFPDAKRPVFLPIKMAYGAGISEEEFNSFCQDPAKDAGKGFTLRLRRNLETGAIADPTNLDLSKSKKESAEAISSALTSDVLKDFFGDQLALFISPKDAGPVKGKDGQLVNQKALERVIPKLNRATLQFHLVCKNSTSKWMIMQCDVKNPVVQSEGRQEIALNPRLRLDSQIAGKGEKTY